MYIFPILIQNLMVRSQIRWHLHPFSQIFGSEAWNLEAPTAALTASVAATMLGLCAEMYRRGCHQTVGNVGFQGIQSYPIWPWVKTGYPFVNIKIDGIYGCSPHYKRRV